MSDNQDQFNPPPPPSQPPAGPPGLGAAMPVPPPPPPMAMPVMLPGPPKRGLVSRIKDAMVLMVFFGSLVLNLILVVLLGSRQVDGQVRADVHRNRPSKTVSEASCIAHVTLPSRPDVGDSTRVSSFGKAPRPATPDAGARSRWAEEVPDWFLASELALPPASWLCQSLGRSGSSFGAASGTLAQARASQARQKASFSRRKASFASPKTYFSHQETSFTHPKTSFSHPKTFFTRLKTSLFHQKTTFSPPDSEKSS